MEINKYKNNGWGLSKQCLLDIKQILNTIDKPNIVEFGSGISTQFLIDYLNEEGKDGIITSFEDNIKYATTCIDNKLNLLIRPLHSCNDVNFSNTFKNKKINTDDFTVQNELTANTRQRNTFYKINDNDIPNDINLVILDGPNGNGRSLSFIYLITKIINGGYVVIDDYNHYDFIEKFNLIFPNNELIFESTTGMINQWNLGGNYKIIQINK